MLDLIAAQVCVCVCVGAGGSVGLGVSVGGWFGVCCVCAGVCGCVYA